MAISQTPNNIVPSPAMNMPGGIPLSRNDPAAAAGSAALTLQVNLQTTETFFTLLAQQIGEIDSQPLHTPQISAVIDSNAATSDTEPTEKNAYQTADAANVSADPTGLVSAVLLQIPVHPQGTPRMNNPAANNGVSTPESTTQATHLPYAPRGGELNPKELKGSLLDKRTDLSATTKNIVTDNLRQNVYKAALPNTMYSETATLAQTPVQPDNASFNNVRLNQNKEFSDTSNDPPALSDKPSNNNPATPVLLAIRDTEQKNNQENELRKVNQPTQNNAPQSLGEPARVDTTLLPSANDSLTLSASDVLKNMVAVPNSTVQHQAIPNNIQVIAAAQPMASPSITPRPFTNIPQTITARLGSSVWANEFSQMITWVSTKQSQTAELQLNPPDLGPLNVVLKISDNQLTAQFISPHSSVRDAVENSLPKLRDVLADNNIMLGNTTVSDQAPHDRSAWEFMDQNSNPEGQRKTSIRAIEPDKTSLPTTPIVPARRNKGILDTFA